MCQPVPAPALATAAGKPQPQVIILNAAGQPTVIQAQTAVAQVCQIRSAKDQGLPEISSTNLNPNFA